MSSSEAERGRRRERRGGREGRRDCESKEKDRFMECEERHKEKGKISDRRLTWLGCS